MKRENGSSGFEKVENIKVNKNGQIWKIYKLATGKIIGEMQWWEEVCDVKIEVGEEMSRLIKYWVERNNL